MFDPAFTEMWRIRDVRGAIPAEGYSCYRHPHQDFLRLAETHTPSGVHDPCKLSRFSTTHPCDRLHSADLTCLTSYVSPKGGKNVSAMSPIQIGLPVTSV
ncbi:hypothetical protein PUNSTDRAFT_55361 [Punctularia strigosozonata HHB-11173 SS5]|uniref:Uncharacterized protein n=1 Tax=Punctularia strigosozonata (strain HHB-11173) TaxID=741275 RepID=R7S456_PUNST|nr:uncharacterized protein PUNSTDRAFT_55361 [Punctularia strigosozonata HHB-11173 SS5]EIN04634.1 hypothetical protein PUNSTDRAFT_55361 [Punctularia strigosozonata HHB-11173 SS5]